MAFGKKGSMEPMRVVGETPAGARPSSPEAGPFMLKFGIGIALMAAWVGLGYGFLKYADYKLEWEWENRGKSPISHHLNEFDGTIDGERDERELAIHNRCKSAATRDLLKLPYKLREKSIETWANGPSSARLQRVADYVACVTEQAPERLCRAASRNRMVDLVLGYFEVQAYERKIDEEDRVFNPGNYFGRANTETADGLPVSILTEPDPRIMRGVRRLVEQGYLDPGDFSGLFSGAPQPLAALLAEAMPRATPCA